MTGILVLASALAVAAAFGLWRKGRDGRVRPVASAPPSSADSTSTRTLSRADVGSDLGQRATLLQFSSSFCQPCRVTRLVLADVADTVPGVSHVEISVEDRMDLVERMNVRRTPTTLVLDEDGTLLWRATGAPRKSEVLAAVAAVV